MRSVIVRIDESRVEVELIDLVKFRPEALGWHFRYPQPVTELREEKKEPPEETATVLNQEKPDPRALWSPAGPEEAQTKQTPTARSI